MKKMVSLIACLFVGSVQASFITSGNIYAVDGGSSVDYWGFSVATGGTVTMNILSWEAGAGVLEGHGPIRAPARDLNGDGEIAFLDTYISLFADDGLLSADDLIGFSDEGWDENRNLIPEAFADGSDFQYDSFLSLMLDAGSYILAIGAYELEVEEVIAGLNDDALYQSTCLGAIGEECIELLANDHGDYQITWSDNAAITSDPGTAQAVPEPISLLFLGLGIIGLGLSRKTKTK